jgi:AraC-like DNA-binding protein
MFKDRKPWQLKRDNPFSVIWYIYKGSVSVQTKGRSILASEGSLLMLPLRSPFNAQLSNNCPFTRIQVIRFSLLTPENIDWLQLFDMPILYPPEVHNISLREWTKLLLVFKSHSPMRQLDVNSLFTLFFSRMAVQSLHKIKPIASPVNYHANLVNEIKSELREMLDKKITLSQLANRHHISIELLIRIFKKTLGISPIQYLIQMRIDEAKQLLLLSQDPIATIAEKVGFEDQLYFSRVFKKKVGITPSQFRKVMRGL